MITGLARAEHAEHLNVTSGLVPTYVGIHLINCPVTTITG